MINPIITIVCLAVVLFIFFRARQDQLILEYQLEVIRFRTNSHHAAQHRSRCGLELLHVRGSKVTRLIIEKGEGSIRRKHIDELKEVNRLYKVRGARL